MNARADAAAVEPRVADRFGPVAISHDWLTIPGGSEKVVLAMLELLPDAEIFTSIYDPRPWPDEITGRPVHPSFLDRLPGARRHYPKLLPLLNAAFESFDLSGFDLIVSSNHSCAKNVLAPPGALHVCYCHTPMRYAWEPRFLEREVGPIARLAIPALTKRLRRQDARAAARPDHFVANSTHVADRIRRYYGREATVIHPPVEVERFLDRPRTGDDYYLFLGRLVPYKRADLAIAACTRLGRRLKVVGGGRAGDSLRPAAGSDVELLGEVPDARLEELLSGARALLFPGEEDFGIVPVEAQAAGVPVVAYGVGGVRDTVVDGETGVLYDEQSVEALCQGILEFESLELDDARLRRNAQRFARERFRERFGALLTELADAR